MNNCGKILWHQKTFVSHKFSRIELHLIKLQAMTDNFNNGNSHSRRISEHNTSQKMLNPATENATTATVLLHVIRKLGSTKKQKPLCARNSRGKYLYFWRHPNFHTIQCRISQRKPPRQKIISIHQTVLTQHKLVTDTHRDRYNTR